ncbi:hypothetical protein, partial [Undibacterium sp.]|uniref:hypothetical protein n=1 Tax=Undibacterium sp. TaxID=1914977 RepID=UPI00374D7908
PSLSLLHKYRGKCVISRIANSGGVFLVTQVFFVAFYRKCILYSSQQGRAAQKQLRKLFLNDFQRETPKKKTAPYKSI